MQIDWITWGIWSIGFAILMGWLVNVVGEILALLRERRKQDHERLVGSADAGHD